MPYLKAGRGMRRFGMALGDELAPAKDPEPSVFDTITGGVKDLFNAGASATAGVLQTVAATPTTTTVPAPASTGMGTTTKLAIAGGAVLIAALVLRRK